MTVCRAIIALVLLSLVTFGVYSCLDKSVTHKKDIALSEPVITAIAPLAPLTPPAVEAAKPLAEEPAVVTVTAVKAKPVKAAASTCSKAEREAYAKAFKNAERANELLGRVAFNTGPGPC